MYGEDLEDSPSDSRPNSLLGPGSVLGPVAGHTPDKPLSLQIPLSISTFSSSNPEPQHGSSSDSAPRLLRTTSDQSAVSSQPGQITLRKSMTFPARTPGNARNGSFDNPLRSPISPTLKDVQDESQFPLTNIENPNDIAQELSNLQALRRMSMDVGNTTTDPDFMFGGNNSLTIPVAAPSGDDDDTDPSRLLWVPASVHPELAPTEFKSFLERRVAAMKRRSTESSLSVDTEQSDSASGGLRRKKSMLSRQVDRRSGDEYVDGAERLERKRSMTGVQSGLPKLTLDELVKDPTKAVQKLQHIEKGNNLSSLDDLPILPGGGMGLRRSTRTMYQKGGSMRANKTFAKRMQVKSHDSESTEIPKRETPPGHGLTRVHSEPISDKSGRPDRAVRRRGKFSHESTQSTSSAASTEDQDEEATKVERPLSPEQPPPARTSSMVSTRSSSQQQEPIVVKTPPFDQEELQVAHPTRGYPQRASSQTSNASAQLSSDEPSPKSGKRSVSRPLNTPQSIKQSGRDQRSESISSDISHRPTGFSNADASRTESMIVIPTFNLDDKKERKGRKEREEESESPSTISKSSWKWFKGGDSKDKKKQQQQEEKKTKMKGQGDKTHDNARLDVIDNAIGKGRESFAMERDSVELKPQDERRKEGHKKNSESKKEKDGLLASLFGVSKKKLSDKESTSKKSHAARAISPEPAFRELVPDKDYNWTRFPLIKERAIYRLAHMKLANPRRSLHSQVLLSNFMYSYLAKVQAMHPQMQVPQSPQQKRLEEERRRKEQEEQYFLEQQQQQQRMSQEMTEQGSLEQFNFEYHRVSRDKTSFLTTCTIQTLAPQCINIISLTGAYNRIPTNMVIAP